MYNIDIRAYEDVLVVHFGTEHSRINAYTLATTLVNIADAARAANADLNPGYDIQIVVEALGEGSFKAKVRAVFDEAANLFSKESLKTIVLAVIAAYVYQHTLAPSAEVSVHLQTDEVIVKYGEDRVIIPRDVYDATQDIERNQRFKECVGEAMQSIAEDEEISSIGFAPSPRDEKPDMPIPRESLNPLYVKTVDDQPDIREIIVTAELQILRAILARSKRRWEFVWNGMRISAPVTDGDFFDDFFARRVTIAPGDSLRTKLKIKQRRDRDLDIYINESFEVIKVMDHVSRGNGPGDQLSEFET